MAYTFQVSPSGNVEVFQNGTRITTTTPQSAATNYGYTGAGAPTTALQQVQASGGTGYGQVNQAPQAPMPTPIAPPPAATAPITPPNMTGGVNPTANPSPSPTAPSPTAPQPTAPTTQSSSFSFTPSAPRPSPQVTFNPVAASGSSLVDFANALDEVVAKGRMARNAGSAQLMQGAQGVVKASDFNSLLGSLNNASASTASDLTKRALSAATPSFQTQQIGDKMYQMQYDSTGRFMGATEIASGLGGVGSFQYNTSANGTVYEYEYTPEGQLINITEVGKLPTEAVNDGIEYVPGTAGSYEDGNGKQWFRGQKKDGTWVEYEMSGAPTPPKATGDGTVGTKISGNMVYNDQDISAGKSLLEQSKNQGAEADGIYADPNVYLSLFKAWLEDGGKEAEFLKLFPYGEWVNPANTWLRDSMTALLQAKAGSSGSTGLENPFD